MSINKFFNFLFIINYIKSLSHPFNVKITIEWKAMNVRAKTLISKSMEHVNLASILNAKLVTMQLVIAVIQFKIYISFLET